MVADLLLRGLIGGIFVSTFALLADLLTPKSFAGLFGAAPSVAPATLLMTIRQKGPSYAALEARSMLAGGAHCQRAVAAVVWNCGIALDDLLSMTIGFTTRGLRQASTGDFLIRFLFGVGITALTGVIAHWYGPTIGGLFLAFPAILPASLTLLVRHQRDRKTRRGLEGAIRGGQAAALDALGAFLGSAGLLVFAALVWQLLPRYGPALVLVAATAGWATTAYVMWSLRKR